MLQIIKYGNEKVYSKGFQNTPYFYLSAFIGVIGSHSNLRCFEKNVPFYPRLWKIMKFSRKISKNIFFCTIWCLLTLICLFVSKTSFNESYIGRYLLPIAWTMAYCLSTYMCNTSSPGFFLDTIFFKFQTGKTKK